MSVPILIRAKRWVIRVRRSVNRRLRPLILRRLGPNPRIVIGAGRTFASGWIGTDQECLDLLKPADWSRWFAPDSVAALLAEHVWEHLTPEEGLAAARTCFTYLQPGGYLRIAVPDGLHPSSEYLSWVGVNGASPMQHSNGHRVLYTYRTLTDMLEQAGFIVTLYEYFDEEHRFHSHPWRPEDGFIRRSVRYDKRNKSGLVFTSIILDARKPAAVPRVQRVTPLIGSEEPVEERVAQGAR